MDEQENQTIPQPLVDDQTATSTEPVVNSPISPEIQSQAKNTFAAVPESQPVEKKSKRGLILLVIAIAVILLITLCFVFLKPKSNSGSKLPSISLGKSCATYSANANKEAWNLKSINDVLKCKKEGVIPIQPLENVVANIKFQSLEMPPALNKPKKGLFHLAYDIKYNGDYSGTVSVSYSHNTEGYSPQPDSFIPNESRLSEKAIKDFAKGLSYNVSSLETTTEKVNNDVTILKTKGVMEKAGVIVHKDLYKIIYQKLGTKNSKYYSNIINISVENVKDALYKTESKYYEELTDVIGKSPITLEEL